MLRRLFVTGAIVSCAIHHHIQIQLGPTPDIASAGFLCKDPVDESQYLFARAFQPSPPRLEFQLVIDIIDLGGEFPNCLAEDIKATCADESGPCKLLRSVAPTRVCKSVSMDFDVTQNPAQQISDYLHATYPTIITDATDRPVILRAVATLQSCDSIQVPAANNPQAWVHLDSDPPSSPTAKNIVLGCAYSCPVVLDQVGNEVSLGLDLGLISIPNDTCIATIDACAKFPAPAN